MTENEKAQIDYNASESLANLPFTTTEIICKRVNWLRSISELSWPEIAALAEFEPIPFGTLQQIYETGKMAHKWKKHLRWRPTHPRNRRAINLDDPVSAEKTIRKSGASQEYRYELVRLLLKHIYD